MRVLIACEFSGTVRDAFSRLGHNATSCDFQPTEQYGSHYQGDIRELLDKEWDLMIAHPPCTYLANSGVRWLHTQLGRRRKMWKDAFFFKLLLDAPISRVCIENPIMHRYAVEIVGRRQDQVIQPWMFGHGETKATCLWLKNLPKLRPTDIVSGRVPRVHYLPPSPDRAKLRSITYQGIAEAMATQWTLPVNGDKTQDE